MKIRAYAKVNLCLSVEHPPVDGYHRLESVFQTIDLHDTLEFRERELSGVPCERTRAGSAVVLDCDVPGLAVRDNLVFRALDRIEQETGGAVVPAGSELHVHVEKRIPAGGGLGGGSADAAAAIRAYARRYGIDPLDDRCLRTARALGADVAFFLYGGAALMTGRGDELASRLPSFPLPLVLMGDNRGASTPEVYRRFDTAPVRGSDASALAAALEDGVDAAGLARLCANNLQAAACAVVPGLQARVERAAADPDVLAALVSGSGATSYAVCADAGAAARFAERIAPQCDWVASTVCCDGL